MPNHTPGPWAVERRFTGDEDQVSVMADGCIWIADCDPDDAYLLAAAPEMLSAMKSADKWLSKAEPSFATEQARGFLEQAIAKAEARDG